MHQCYLTSSIHVSKLFIFTSSFLKFKLFKFKFKGFGSIGGLPSWRIDKCDICVVYFSFIELASAGFDYWQFLILVLVVDKTINSLFKIHQFISVGIGVSGGPFLMKGCSEDD